MNESELNPDTAKPAAEPTDPAAFLTEVVQRFADAEEYYRENVDEHLKDQDMLDPEKQWPTHIREQRRKKKRPCLSFPRLPQYLDQVTGEWRKNRPQIRVRLAAGAAVKLASQAKVVGMDVDPKTKTNKKYGYDEVMAGLIRNIEYQSQAATAYDYGFEGAVTGGIGHWRIISGYIDDESFDQDIYIDRIHDHVSVYWDPAATKYTREDANYCFLVGSIGVDDFKARYPGAVTSSDSIAASGNARLSSWSQANEIRVAEYFVKEPTTRTLVEITGPDGKSSIQWQDKVEPVLDELAANGYRVLRSRKVETYKVVWYLITGMDLLEGPVEINSRYIPVVPVWGKESYREGKWKFRSLIRNAHDAQRQYNYMRSAEVEQTALAPKAPYVITAEQVEGHEKMWREANTENYPYLVYNAVEGQQRPSRENPPTPSTAHQASYMAANEDIKATIGMYDASLGNRSNETSGRAILARANEGDTMAFPFIDNAASSIAYTGRILADMIPRIYDTQRVMRIRHEDDTEDTVEINKTVRDAQTNKDVIIHDLSAYKYEITVDVGPSFVSRRLESAESMREFASGNPQLMQVAGDLIAKAQEWPGAEEIAERIRKTLPPQLLQSEDDTGKPKEPDPNLVIQNEMQKREEKLKEMEFTANMARADADKAMAEAKKMEAQAKISENDEVIQASVTNILRKIGVLPAPTPMRTQ